MESIQIEITTRYGKIMLFVSYENHVKGDYNKSEIKYSGLMGATAG